MTPPIEMRVTCIRDGAEVATAEWGGQTFEVRTPSGRSALRPLASKLVGAGAPDWPWRTDTPPGPSLHRLAAFSLTDEDDAGFRLKLWEPHPKASGEDWRVHALLEPARAAVRQRRPSGSTGGPHLPYQPATKAAQHAHAGAGTGGAK